MSSSTPPTDTGDEASKASAAAQSAERRQGRKDLTFALLVCFILVVVVRSFLFEPFKIPSSSMVPTLLIGDHIFVSKFNYGISLPFTKIPLLRWGEPRRGDVIVFLFPRDESLYYVKRVMGVPGDHIVFKGHEIYINGEKIPREKLSDPNEITRVTGGSHLDGDIYRETVDGEVHYVEYGRSAVTNNALDSESDTVPPNEYFVLGDNRDDSYDSRSWGFVPRENIKGKAELIWLSLDQENAWSSADKIRWPRCMALIH